jgi:hypothetical protein
VHGEADERQRQQVARIGDRVDRDRPARHRAREPLQHASVWR